MTTKISDIAKLANVSNATVSMVLNNKPGISEATRIKVLGIAEEHGYILNQKTFTQSGVIQLIMCRKHAQVLTDTAFFQELILGIENHASYRGYKLNLKTINITSELAGSLELSDSKEVDGIILLATEMSVQDISVFNSIGKPLLILDAYFTGDNMVHVGIDNFGGTNAATSYLIDSGHKDIGYLKSSVEIVNFRQRYEAYRSCLLDASLTYDSSKTVLLSPNISGAYEDMLTYLRKKPTLATAYVADNDLIAAGAMKALKEVGVRIPEDVSIVGFDDMPFCTVMDPALTTIYVAKQALGEEAIERLESMILKRKVHPSKTMMTTKLIERNSVLDKNN